MDGMIINGMDIPKWMTIAILWQIDPSKENVVDNYRPILCLPLMWKLMTEIKAIIVYEFLKRFNLLPVEQKGCRRNSRRTRDQL